MSRILQARRRAGFTLIETIVTVGLIAVLAAFVIPNVVQKSGVGDPIKVTNDLNAIRTGLDNFASDTKAGYPRLVSDLTTKPSMLSKLLNNVNTLSVGQIDSWNGPYLNATLGGEPTDSMPTGYAASIGNELQRYDMVNDIGETVGGTGASFSAAHTLFVAIKVTGLTAAQAEIINKMIDGPSDPNVATGLNKGANTTGRFRFEPPNANHIVVAHFMAAPIT
jgi:prepilin-type N-terminal cleavage/methylation domain-containing protein